MGIGRFLKSIVNNEIMGKEIVGHNVKAYFAAKRMAPNGTTLEWLSAAYYGRMRARQVVVSDFDANYACSQFDKLPEPNNARALGLTMLMQERMDIFSGYPKFSDELSLYLEHDD